MTLSTLTMLMLVSIALFYTPAVNVGASQDEQTQNRWTVTRPGDARRDFNAVFFLDAKLGWIAGDEGNVMHTEDGGATWTKQDTKSRAVLSDIHFVGKETGFITAGNVVLSTTDGGQNWIENARFSAVNFGGGTPELLSIHFVNKRRGYIVGSLVRRERVIDSLVLYTANGGASWERQTVPIKSELIDVDFAGSDKGWIVGAEGTILGTRDGGETWTVQRANTDATLYSVEFRNNRTGWVVGESGVVLRTTDGGESWFPVRVPVRSILLAARFVSDEDGFIVGRGGVILRSSDGGRTWLRQESGTTENLFALYISKRDGWAVGGKGIVLQYKR